MDIESFLGAMRPNGTEVSFNIEFENDSDNFEDVTFLVSNEGDSSKAKERVKTFIQMLVSQFETPAPMTGQSGSAHDKNETVRGNETDGWLESPGNMPCPGDWRIEVKLADGSTDDRYKAQFWNFGDCDKGWPYRITHWRPSGEGWRLHDGEGLPFDYGDRPECDCICRNGKITGTEPGQVVGSWRHCSDEMELDIIWYRIKPESPDEIKDYLDSIPIYQETTEREPLEGWINVPKFENADFQTCYDSKREAIKFCPDNSKPALFREVIPPQIHDRPNEPGIWWSESDDLPIRVKIEYGGSLQYKRYFENAWFDVDMLHGRYIKIAKPSFEG